MRGGSKGPSIPSRSPSRAEIDHAAQSKSNSRNPPTDESLSLGTLNKNSERLKILVAAVALVVLLAWLLSPAIHFGFIYDDHAQIESNHEIQSLDHVGGLLREPLWAQLGPERASPYYRPLFSVWLLIQYTLWGPNAELWHGASIGLHIAVALTLFFFLVLHTGRWLPAFVATCLFGTSPLTAEVANWISASDESLYTLLVLSAFCGLLLASQAANPVRAGLFGTFSALALGIALLTKETAIAGVIAAVFLCGVVLRNARDRLYGASALTVVLALWWAARPHIHVPDYPPLKDVGVTQIYVGCLEIKKLLWPAPVSQFYDLWIGQPHSAVSLALYAAALAAIGIVLVAGALRSRHVAWALLVVALPIAMSLAAIGVFRSYDVFHDRYLYLSLCGLAILVAQGVAKAEKHRRLRNLIVSLIGVVACLQVVTFRSVSGQFRDDLHFYTRAIEVAPHNVMAVQLLAGTELRAGNCDAALSHYQRAEQLRPDLWNTPFDSGIAYLDCGQVAAASAAFRRAASLTGVRQQEAALAWYELGRVLVIQKDFDGARAAVSEAMRRDPASQKLRVLQSQINAQENTQ